jgi:hypothetical protein|nr:hypothetical protein [uncultured Acetatifactor sp.]
MKYELPQIIILTDNELLKNVSTSGENGGITARDREHVCASCGFHVF